MSLMRMSITVRRISILCMSLIVLPFAIQKVKADQIHYYSGGYNLYSMNYTSVDNDNGICYQGARNWQLTAGTTVTQDSGSTNKCYYRSYVENWYGLYSPSFNAFTLKLNKRTISNDFSGSIWAASVNVATHEFGHAQYLGDHDTNNEGIYKTTSIMSYSRNRTGDATPKSHDLSELREFRSSLFNIDKSQVESVADFPHYDIDTLLNDKTDLVVTATVESIKKARDNTDSFSTHQEATLHIKDIIHGDVKSKTIKLYQSVDKVKLNNEYLLFLSYRPEIDQYVVSDGSSKSIIAENSSEISSEKSNTKQLIVKVKGIEGQYTKEELKNIIEKRKSNSSTELLKSR